jgi:hypothetical protein
LNDKIETTLENRLRPIDQFRQEIRDAQSKDNKKKTRSLESFCALLCNHIQERIEFAPDAVKGSAVNENREKGMQLFVEKFALEECREEEFLSDSAQQYSPLIKRKHFNATNLQSPQLERRTTRLHTKIAGYTIATPICPDDSVDYGKTMSLRKATPSSLQRRSARWRLTSN